jgi:hypothetical protein
LMRICFLLLILRSFVVLKTHLNVRTLLAYIVVRQCCSI